MSRTTAGIDFGRRLLVLRGRTVSGLLDLRVLAVVLALVAAALAVAVVSLGTGDLEIAPSRVLETLGGGGTRVERLVVLEWRLPRTLTALLIGAALGASGAIFQSLTRNPLGSPDIIGFNVGAYTGALAVILLVGPGYYGVAAGALAGGLATAFVVYLLAFSGGATGFRLIIVGIAVTAMLQSINTWIILRADLQTAMAAATWGAGTLNGISWAQAVPVAVVFAVLLPAVVGVAGRMPVLELGDDAAAALGLRPERSRIALVVVGVALAAVAAAAAGPISFVALAAPQLARRLTRSAGVTIAPAAAMGAFLLVASDHLAQNLFAPTRLPVGVVTVSVGGVYLIWLLARETRRR